MRTPGPVLALILLAAACNSSGTSSGLTAGMDSSPPGVISASEIVASPDRYAGRTVTVDILEPLRGPTTPEELARTEVGQIYVPIYDAGGELVLVSSAFRPDDPKRYTHKFDRVLTAPLRVHGDFMKDADLAKQSGRPAFVLRAAKIEPLPRPSAVPVASLAVIDADRAAWDRKQITYEGELVSGFEVSSLDRRIWLSTEPQAEVIGGPPEEVDKGRGPRRARVRATGLLFAKPGARYGHLGGSDFELTAHRVEFLPVKQPSGDARPPAPTRAVPLASLAQVDADRAGWDGKQVTYEGEWVTGFEVSSLDRRIWLQTTPQAEILHAPPIFDGKMRRRVRATGVLRSTPGTHYGHIGMYDFELTASRVEFLPAKRP